MYTTPITDYRDLIREHNLSHSSNTSEETQLIILNWMMEEQKRLPKGSKQVFDRCPFDNLVYTLQANQNNLVSDAVTAASISLVRESLKDLDIIFWIKRDPRIKIVQEGLREVNEEFIAQSDNIFADLFHQYCENLESDIFFPKDDCPALIQIEGITPQDRLDFVAEFIDYKGDLIETETSILDPKNADLLEQMLGEQKGEMANEAHLKQIMKQFKGV
jgi:hypothetical protein